MPRKIKKFPFLVHDSVCVQNSQDDPSRVSEMVFKSANAHGRLRPNVLIVGTPGTGKSTLAASLGGAGDTNRPPLYRHIDLSEEIKKNKWYTYYDHNTDAFVFSNKKVRKGLSLLEKSGGNIIDFHSVENVISPAMVDLVIVLRTDNTILFDRLTARNYSPSKVRENVECEIMQVLLDEARAVFEDTQEIPVISLISDSKSDQMHNIQFLRKILRIGHP